MNGDLLPGRVAERLALYRREVLRWNRQFNLVSRLDPEGTLDRLIQRSIAALEQLPAKVAVRDQPLAAMLQKVGISSPPTAGPAAMSPTFKRLYYMDIGSGSGIPGLIWHAIFEEGWAGGAGGSENRESAEGRRNVPRLATVLFEPRGRRAWFLERCIRKMGLSGIRVAPRRWGEGARFHVEHSPMGGTARSAGNDRHRADGEDQAVSGEAIDTGSTLWVISLQAVALGDPQIITGWREEVCAEDLGQNDRLIVARPRSPSAGTPGLLVSCYRKGGLPA